MIIVIDNYDSFVETLARYVREGGGETLVVRNDAVTTGEIEALGPSGIVLSPGPYGPADAGICRALPSAFPGLPILGVCLGHLAIAEAYGGRTVRSDEPVHGRASPMRHEGHQMFSGVPRLFEAGRYHALVTDISASDLLSTARLEAGGEVMALAHPERPHQGVQFHPESVLTPHGRRMIGNFLELTR